MMGEKLTPEQKFEKDLIAKLRNDGLIRNRDGWNVRLGNAKKTNEILARYDKILDQIVRVPNKFRDYPTLEQIMQDLSAFRSDYNK